MASKNPGKKQTPAGGAGTNRREALRQAQAAQAAHQKRMRAILIAVAAAVGIAIIVVAVLGATGRLGTGKNEPTTVVTTLGEQITPPHANADGTGIVSQLGTNASAPTLVVYEDYQCPICKTYEQYFGPTFESLATSGQIQLEYRTRTFLDQNLQQLNESNGTPESSKRAAMAAACADQVGKFQEYHDAAYANAPAQEGNGYTMQQLREDFADTAGITGENLTTFQSCVDQNQTKTFVENVEQAGKDAGVNSTPTFTVNGEQVSFTDADPNSEQSVMDVINAAVA
ncbi:thioredoxin domain-containing protein [uncultured Propionibacterium sp.]|uniref:DsbA family protein n=1 Tax=uncultured Propionibacterium sp. TaxID=218066 RepID=UPI002930CA54|nr:thioredoxin domain-containing protein [uncultured Propionibacterium sp.]